MSMIYYCFHGGKFAGIDEKSPAYEVLSTKIRNIVGSLEYGRGIRYQLAHFEFKSKV